MNIIHKDITVSGIVQGVGFRYACLRAARSYNIKGFVKNKNNGDVYIESEGKEHQQLMFIKWCWEGPPHAQVKNVSYENNTLVNYEVFDIK